MKMKKLNIWTLSLLLGSISEGALSAAASRLGDEGPCKVNRRVFVGATYYASAAGVYGKENKTPVAAARASAAGTPSEIPEGQPNPGTDAVMVSYIKMQTGMVISVVEESEKEAFRAIAESVCRPGLEGSLVKVDIFGALFSAKNLDRQEIASRARNVIAVETKLGFLSPGRLDLLDARMLELLRTPLEKEIPFKDKSIGLLVEEQLKKDLRFERRKQLMVWWMSNFL
tara:strand:- start:425 stop:1108 length:684 start_codon:yes stop_codon:yes gene_type:complete